MKKLIAVAILGLTAVSGWAQGTVDFRNGGITFPTSANRYAYFGLVGPGNVQTGFGPGSADPNRVVGTTWVAGLWYLAGANHNDEIELAVQTGRTFNFRAPTTAIQNQGTWVVPTGVSPLFVLDHPDQLVPVGGSATLQVRVWDSAKFANFADARHGGEFGVSAPFNYTVPTAGSTPDKYYMDNLRAFAIIPEPSTIALGLLGAASLLFLRRRK